MWFLFKILYVWGRNTCLCKGEMCFILLDGVLTSFFLYIGLVTTLVITNIVLISDIYIYIYLMMLLSHFTYLSMCCFFSLFIHMFLIYCMQSICFTLRCRHEFCLKCFRNTGCQSLAMNSFLAKFFKSLY